MERTNVSEEKFLENYHVENYVRPSVATDVVAFSVFSQEDENYRRLPEQTLNVLLIQRGQHPYKDQWALPGGFVKPHETVDETAARELGEETGVKDAYMEQLYTFSEVDRDPRTRVISAAYMALLYERPELSATTDARAAAWFKVSYTLERSEQEKSEEGMQQRDFYTLKLTHEGISLEAQLVWHKKITHGKRESHYEIIASEGIAFDHAKIIAVAIKRLRGKIEYTDVAFYLVPEKFTLTGLQKIYEIVLGKTLTPANFRRKIISRVEETEEVAEGGGFRNAKLYRRSDEWL